MRPTSDQPAADSAARGSRDENLGDLTLFVRAAYGAALGAFLALGLTLVAIAEPDLPARSPSGDLTARPAHLAPSFLLPNVATMYAPERREKTFVLLAWVLGGVGAFGAARHGSRTLGPTWVLLVAVAGAVPGFSAVAAVALPAVRPVGVSIVASALIVLLTVVRRWSGPAVLLKACAVALVGTFLATGRPAPIVHVRWNAHVSEERRKELETELSLARPTPRQGTTWSYELLDTSVRNIRSIVTAEEADDTNDLDRVVFTVSPTADVGHVWWWALWRVPGLSRCEVVLPLMALGMLGLTIPRSPRHSVFDRS